MSIGVGLATPQVAVRGRAAAVFDLAGGVLPAGATLARSSPGGRTNAAGVLVSEASDTARFDHDPVTAVLRGLLIEPSRGNLLSWSEQIDNAAWSRNNCTISANVAAAPDGVSSADKLIPAAAMNQAKCATQSIASITMGTPITFSFFVKAAGYSLVQVFANNTAFGTFYWNVDLAAAAESAFSGAGSTVGGRGVAALGGGWYRLWITLSPLVTQSGGSNVFYVAAVPSASATRNPNWAADGTSGLLLWGIQAEAGAAPTSYIATAAAGVTRSADVLTLGWGGKGVADGAITARVTFDDGSSQTLAMTVAGGSAVLPTALDRRWVRRIERL